MNGLSLHKASDGNVYLEDQLERSLTSAGLPAEKKAIKPTWPAETVALLDGYNRILELAPISKICWPAELFLAKDIKKETPATEIIDLTGPARFLVHGPHLGLPRGEWKIAVSFDVASNISSNVVALDICQKRGQDVLVMGEAEMPASGAFCCDMTFLVSNPHLPIVLRLAIKQGAIEGKLRFLGAELERI